MTLSARYIDAALAELPHAEEGTPERRQIAAAREYMLMALTRLVTLESKAKKEPRNGQ